MQYNVSLCNGDSGNNHLKSFNVDISRILLGLGTFLHVNRCGSWPLYLHQGVRNLNLKWQMITSGMETFLNITVLTLHFWIRYSAAWFCQIWCKLTRQMSRAILCLVQVAQKIRCTQHEMARDIRRFKCNSTDAILLVIDLHNVRCWSVNSRISRNVVVRMD